MIVFFAVLIFIFLVWTFTKSELWKFYLTILLIATPSILISIKNHYIYASSIFLVLTSIMLFYNFKQKNKILVLKSLYTIPLILIVLYAFKSNEYNLTSEYSSHDILVAIMISILAVFISGLSLILILTRTKGEKKYD